MSSYFWTVLGVMGFLLLAWGTLRLGAGFLLVADGVIWFGAGFALASFLNREVVNQNRELIKRNAMLEESVERFLSLEESAADQQENQRFHT